MAGSDNAAFDTTKFINTSQIGGIEAYTIDEGPARGVRALCVNTGGGLRYRVLVDRGMDIDQASWNQHNLTFLTHKGVTPPSRGYDRGLDWLRSFFGGLLTTCGPTNLGPPGKDGGEELGLHGPHSNTAAAIESVVLPDAHAKRTHMSITGSVRYGGLYNPCVELRRTILSELGASSIEFTDEFFNAGNQAVPHAWLLHINFGYPLVDSGAEFCYNSSKQPAPVDEPESHRRFAPGSDYKRIPGPQEKNRGPTSAVAAVFPKPTDRKGNTTVAIVNRKLPLAVAIHYNTREFPRCGNWQHFGPGEYVTALEPMNGTVNGRWNDRASGMMDTIEPGARKLYSYSIEVVSDRRGIEELRKLNGTT